MPPLVENGKLRERKPENDPRRFFRKRFSRRQGFPWATGQGEVNTPGNQGGCQGWSRVVTARRPVPRAHGGNRAPRQVPALAIRRLPALRGKGSPSIGA